MRYSKLAIVLGVGAFLLLASTALGAVVEPTPDSIGGEPAGSVQGELAPASEPDFVVSNGSSTPEAAPPKADAQLSAVAAARTDNRSKPVLFLHGLSRDVPASSNCDSSFDDMRAALHRYGLTGTTRDIGYYYGDVGCGSQIDMLSSHAKHYPTGHACCNARGYKSHTAETDIRHLSYHLAWWIYYTYSRYGQRVDIVAHSMGGLISRYAIQQSGRHPDFPPYIYVEDVVTLGTPHAGGQFTSLCFNFQCDQMGGGSSFLTWMAANASNPQASGGTDWTTVGSYNDNAVTAGSATSMNASHRVRYTKAMGIEHSEYMHETGTAWTRDVTYWDRGFTAYKSWLNAPYVVGWADQALAYGSW